MGAPHPFDRRTSGTWLHHTHLTGELPAHGRTTPTRQVDLEQLPWQTIETIIVCRLCRSFPSVKDVFYSSVISSTSPIIAFLFWWACGYISSRQSQLPLQLLNSDFRCGMCSPLQSRSLVSSHRELSPPWSLKDSLINVLKLKSFWILIKIEGYASCSLSNYCTDYKLNLLSNYKFKLTITTYKFIDLVDITVICKSKSYFHF